MLLGPTLPSPCPRFRCPAGEQMCWGVDSLKQSWDLFCECVGVRHRNFCSRLPPFAPSTLRRPALFSVPSRTIHPYTTIMTSTPKIPVPATSGSPAPRFVATYPPASRWTGTHTRSSQRAASATRKRSSSISIVNKESEYEHTRRWRRPQPPEVRVPIAITVSNLTHSPIRRRVAGLAVVDGRFNNVVRTVGDDNGSVINFGAYKANQVQIKGLGASWRRLLLVPLLTTSVSAGHTVGKISFRTPLRVTLSIIRDDVAAHVSCLLVVHQRNANR